MEMRIHNPLNIERSWLLQDPDFKKKANLCPSPRFGSQGTRIFGPGPETGRKVERLYKNIPGLQLEAVRYFCVLYEDETSIFVQGTRTPFFFDPHLPSLLSPF